MDIQLVILFGLMYLHALLFGLVGGVVGTVLAVCLAHYPKVAQVVGRFLRSVIWLSLILMCAVPEWQIEGNPFFSLAAIISVSSYTCRETLLLRLNAGMDWFLVVPLVGRLGFLHALFVALYSQFISASSWIARLGQGAALNYGFLILAGILFLAIVCVCHGDFDRIAELQRKILTQDLVTEKLSDRMVTLACVLSLILFWYFVGSKIAPNFAMGHLVTVFGRIGQEVILHARTSLMEIGLGMLLASSAALIVWTRIVKSTKHRWISRIVLPITYLSPWFLMIIVSGWVGQRVEFWHPVIGVTLLTFYHFVASVWKVDVRTLSFHTALGIYEALPFAFLAMIGGEIWIASQGLGFLMIMSTAAVREDEAVVVSLFIFLLFAISSTILRVLAKLLSRAT